MSQARVISITFETQSQSKRRGRFSVPKRVADLLNIAPGADVRIEVTSSAGHFGPAVKTLKSDREPSPAGEMADWMEPGELITVVVARA
jgi:bifunctional DNA-binding transcriptional regulator/antitoxin component of YhaV-PrlF toxin-antitoxin module